MGFTTDFFMGLSKFSSNFISGLTVSFFIGLTVSFFIVLTKLSRSLDFLKGQESRGTDLNDCHI